MVPGLYLTAVWLTTTSSLVNIATATNANATAPIVDLGYARYQGYFDAQNNITSFLSIRYAAPPVGKLRFQAPQPPFHESGVQPATQTPNICYQAFSGVQLTAPVPPYGSDNHKRTTVASEDCLYLNVFVPGTIPTEPDTTRGLPVLIWIHGGGYLFESGSINYGADLVVDSLNTMVVVAIQYRLGAFGFLAGNEIKAQGALNAGLLDQTFALQWVQDHIRLFGGDKTHVTIWGESAGAGSVLQHIVANGGNTQPPLFHAAIASSTFLPSQYHYNDRVPQLLYNEIVNMTECASSADTFTCLQSVEADKFETVNEAITGSGFSWTSILCPVVDGTYIVERPTVTLAKGRVNGQVLLAVGNQNEGNLFVDANETLKITDYVSRLFPDMTFFQVRAAASIYDGYGTAVEQAIQVMGDSIFVCPNYYLLRAFSGRSWKGQFAIPPAYHGQDVSYYFHNAPPPYGNMQFATAFVQSFISLAKYYDVNVKFDPSNITPHWDKYNMGETEMLFNRTEAGAPVVTPIKTDPALERRCAFWATVTGTTAQ